MSTYLLGWHQTVTAASSLDWINPGATSFLRTSDLPNTQQTPVLLSNLDCINITYRTPVSTNMKTGCFVPTAFGWLGDGSTVIFNSSDEGLPIIKHTSDQILVPWPDSQALLSLHTLSTGGAMVGLYKNPLTMLKDERDASLNLIAKRLTAAPDLIIRYESGQPLVINAQTLAFSDNAAWAVAETLHGSFVRINLASLQVMPFAPSYAPQGHPGPFKSFVSITDDGKHVVIANNFAQELKFFNLSVCGPEAGALQAGRCVFKDYWPVVARQIPQLQSILKVRFTGSDRMILNATSLDANHSGVYVLSPSLDSRSLLEYLSLGDSYTSGEGAFNYKAGTDTDGNLCHLSMHSYPLRIARERFSLHSGQSIACSGAKLADIGSLSQKYKGQARDGKPLEQLDSGRLEDVLSNFRPGYIPQGSFVKRYQPEAISVSIGGNDIGFGNIIERCVVPKISLSRAGNDCYRTYEDRLEVLQLVDKTIPGWIKLFKQLGKSSPLSRLYVIGYPSVVNSQGYCETNVRLSQAELEFADNLTAYLNDRIRQAAMEAGAYYIDISSALVGHRLCEGKWYSQAVNGITAGKDIKIKGLRALGRESFHPNALGHELVAKAFLEQAEGLRRTTFSQDKPPNSSQTWTASLTNAPRTGRAVTTIVPATDLVPSWVESGSHFPVYLDGLIAGLRPNTPYQVRLNGMKGQVIATVHSDINGKINAVVRLPANVPSGGHTIDVTGPGQGSQPVTVDQPVYVPALPDDSDGDQIPDSQDSCLTALNSKQDKDLDGIDDICDGNLGTPKAISNNPPKAHQTALGSIATKSIGINQFSSLAPSAGFQASKQHTISERMTAIDNIPKPYRQPMCQQKVQPSWRAWLLLMVLAWLVITTTFYKITRRPKL